MINYNLLFSNHFRFIQRWGASSSAKVELDVVNFVLQISLNNRYYKFFPQYYGRVGGQLAYMSSLTEDVFGFAGWLPYRPISYELSTDKLRFKRYLQSVGVCTPSFWLAQDFDQVAVDYILKLSVGSFGNELTGPYKATTHPNENSKPIRPVGELYAEQFVKGHILKVWFWGRRVFYAHLVDMAEIQCDGVSTVHDLIQTRLASIGQNLETCKDKVVIDTCLSFQDINFSSIPDASQKFLIDYRYGRDYLKDGQTQVSDNKLTSLTESVLHQLDLAGNKICDALSEQFSAPVLYALDGILDADNKVWWLEINSNPVLPPEGYKEIFADMFGNT
jgi:hypothetical protein